MNLHMCVHTCTCACMCTCESAESCSYSTCACTRVQRFAEGPRPFTCVRACSRAISRASMVNAFEVYCKFNFSPIHA